MCPTSELPICPSGRPTARPEAWRAQWGKWANQSSSRGVSAMAMALLALLGLSPKPSRMIRITGRRGAFVTGSLMGGLLQLGWIVRAGVTTGKGQ